MVSSRASSVREGKVYKYIHSVYVKAFAFFLLCSTPLYVTVVGHFPVTYDLTDLAS